MREHQREEREGRERSGDGHEAKRPPERRAAYRVKTPGARADCVVLDGQGVYKLVDVSPDGARLRGDLEGEGALVVGSHADMLLRSPGRLIPTNGRVVREHVGPREDGGGAVEVGVAFEHPWPGAREAVEDMMVDYIVRRHEHATPAVTSGGSDSAPTVATAAARGATNKPDGPGRPTGSGDAPDRP